MLIALAT